MRDIAAYLIVLWTLLAALFMVIFLIGGSSWQFEKSPESGYCYEIRTTWGGLTVAQQSMSMTHDKYCEKED